MTDRFLASVLFAPNGCWIWQGPVLKTGYAEHRYYEGGARRYRRAHRVAYERFVGVVPNGLQLDHTCHTAAVVAGQCTGGVTCMHRRCVNPAHLEPVTAAQNALRSATAQKTECVNGHPFDEQNTGWIHRSNGRVERRCLTCLRESSRRYRAESRQHKTEAVS